MIIDYALFLILHPNHHLLILKKNNFDNPSIVDTQTESKAWKLNKTADACVCVSMKGR